MGSGGGIGGLTLALALSKSRFHETIIVNIYEAAPELSEIGAGIAFLPRTWEILKILGLAEALADRLTHPPGTKPSKSLLSSLIVMHLTASQVLSFSSERVISLKEWQSKI
jgi:2-polyprenyl-6-methoxyphenol hydroxylase-like FAD-dependent oxidoreductase